MNKTVSKLFLSGMLSLSLIVGTVISNVSLVAHAEETTSTSSSLTVTPDTDTVTRDQEKQNLLNDSDNKRILANEAEGIDDNDASIEAPTVVSRDDFNNDNEYYSYLRTHPYVKATDAISTRSADVAMAGATTAAKEYAFEGLQRTTVIQKAYIGSTYIYVTQLTGQDLYLSRCRIEGDVAVYQDEMKLTDFGHSQTLEEFKYNDEYYFWIGCKGVETTSSGIPWSTQVARIQYSPGELKYTDAPRFSSINYLNNTGASNGSMTRSDSALSSTTNRLFIWTKNGDGTAHYASYDATQMNQILDEAVSSGGNLYVPFTDSRVHDAYIAGHSMTLSVLTSLISYDSIQGFEYNDADAIYISSGQEGDTPAMVKFAWDTTSGSKVTLNNSEFGSTTETEGMQLKGDDVYLVVDFHDSPNVSMIYSIPKSAF